MTDQLFYDLLSQWSDSASDICKLCGTAATGGKEILTAPGQTGTSDTGLIESVNPVRMISDTVKTFHVEQNPNLMMCSDRIEIFSGCDQTELTRICSSAFSYP